MLEMFVPFICTFTVSRLRLYTFVWTSIMLLSVSQLFWGRMVTDDNNHRSNKKRRVLLVNTWRCVTHSYRSYECNLRFNCNIPYFWLPSSCPSQCFEVWKETVMWATRPRSYSFVQNELILCCFSCHVEMSIYSATTVQQLSIETPPALDAGVNFNSP